MYRILDIGSTVLLIVAFSLFDSKYRSVHALMGCLYLSVYYIANSHH